MVQPVLILCCKCDVPYIVMTLRLIVSFSPSDRLFQIRPLWPCRLAALVLFLEEVTPQQ